MNLRTHAALALDRKKLAAFSALGGGFLLFPIGDRRCNRTRASVGNAGGNARPSLTNATLAASRLLHRRSPTAPCSKGALAAHRKKLAAFSALGGDCGSQRGPGSVIILRTISRSALTSAIGRFVSSPLSACAGALSGGLEAGLDVLGLSAFDVSCCSPFDDSTPPAPQMSNRATADDNWRSKLVRLLECGRRQKAQHTTHNVGMIVVTVARVLDRVLAASMRAPLKQTQLANEPRIVGQPR